LLRSSKEAVLTRFYIAALAAAFVLAATAADAHPRLKDSSPAAGSILKNTPASIRISFSEGLIARFTGLVLKDSGGRAIPTGDASVSGPDNTQLTVPIRGTLKPGTYRVTWHAVSVDTHRVTGSYAFRILP
jgi:methionine-rich copper-binding protein CopC